jgi:hypothetical protein
MRKPPAVLAALWAGPLTTARMTPATNPAPAPASTHSGHPSARSTCRWGSWPVSSRTSCSGLTTEPVVASTTWTAGAKRATAAASRPGCSVHPLTATPASAPVRASHFFGRVSGLSDDNAAPRLELNLHVPPVRLPGSDDADLRNVSPRVERDHAEPQRERTDGHTCGVHAKGRVAAEGYRGQHHGHAAECSDDNHPRPGRCRDQQNHGGHRKAVAHADDVLWGAPVPRYVARPGA